MYKCICRNKFCFKVREWIVSKIIFVCVFILLTNKTDKETEF